MEMIIQLILATVLIAFFICAVRMHRRAVSAPLSRELQRSVIAMCTDVMANSQHPQRVRNFAKLMAVLAMSEKTLWAFGRDDKLRNLVVTCSAEDVTDSEVLSEADKRILQPAVEAFAMASLLNDPKYSRHIRRHWEQIVSASFARANSKSPSITPAPQPAPRVEKELSKVEQRVVSRVKELCHA